MFGAQEGGRRVDPVPERRLDRADRRSCSTATHHNQPVDVVVDSKGRVWFADAYNAQPPYGPPAYPFLPSCLGAARWTAGAAASGA